MVVDKADVCLKLQELGVRVNGRWVLRDIHLSICRGEIVSIIGPNGAGKTTLFNVITGQVRTTRGTLWYRGKDISRWPPYRICRSGIARTFQIARPFAEMTTLENVLIGVRFGKPGGRKVPQARQTAMELLELVGLAHKAMSVSGALTLSEQRRLEVARALATRPDLLLLDEIAAGLSPRAVDQAVEMIRALRRQGLTLLVIDHFLNLTAKVSDRLIAMDQGEVITGGRPADVIGHREVISAYLGERPPPAAGEAGRS